MTLYEEKIKVIEAFYYGEQTLKGKNKNQKNNIRPVTETPTNPGRIPDLDFSIDIQVL
jgi:hypothetical protein